MEVHLSPETEAKLAQMARENDCRSDELVESALVGYFEGLDAIREVLDRRYDDLESGRVQAIDGEEAFRSLMAKTEVKRRQRPVRA